MSVLPVPCIGGAKHSKAKSNFEFFILKFAKNQKKFLQILISSEMHRLKYLKHSKIYFKIFEENGDQ